eukprot:CAMPEP_0197741236 /NCGR_PEP_ID=MMETSP1435-20131217/26969_1 /TAXON_ID=426625 /ORGANISM="Chaetoceros brevis, Strain CCMP164" /LENGTH=156 /DNA_ID=CAMNT_0043331281 /DNA_START=49 /DNA_END=519 /DNA_ORIENTATION=-
MDKTFCSLTECEFLSLSTNSIDRMGSLAGMTKLKTLSIGRNNLKKIEKLDDVASTLEQLWMSYNSVSSLDGLSCLKNLQTIYMSNNAIKSFDELDHLAGLENLKEVLFYGNPMYEEVADQDVARLHILSRLPNLTKIDGVLVKPQEREEAKTILVN